MVEGAYCAIQRNAGTGHVTCLAVVLDRGGDGSKAGEYVNGRELHWNGLFLICSALIGARR